MSDDLRKAKAYLKQIINEDELQGYMGRPDGAGGWIYAVPHHPGYVYVRVLEAGRVSIAEAINLGAAENPSILVELERKNGILVVRRPDAASAAHVLGEDINESLVGGTPLTSGFSYVGYNTVGASQETVSSDGREIRYKGITITETGLLLSIGMYLTASQTFPNPTKIGMQVFLMSDDGGAPANVIAMGADVFTHVMGTDGRWVDLPIVKLLTAGDYWLAFRGTGSASNVMTIAHDSGSDIYHSVGATVTVDYPPYTGGSSSGNKYSIRGGILR